MLSVFLALHIHGFNEICNSEFAIMLGFYFLSIFIFTSVQSFPEEISMETKYLTPCMVYIHISTNSNYESLMAVVVALCCADLRVDNCIRFI